MVANEPVVKATFQAWLNWLSLALRPPVAICMACDMELRLFGISSFIQEHADVSVREDVTFTQVDGPFHRDAVRFRNGRVVTLQALGPGVVAHVCESPIEREFTLPMKEAAVA